MERERREQAGSWGGSVSFLHRAVGPSSALVLIAAVTRGRDESNPRCERSAESLPPVFFRARTKGAMFSTITRVGYIAIIKF